jgi:hypothetical protein
VERFSSSHKAFPRLLPNFSPLSFVINGTVTPSQMKEILQFEINEDIEIP